MQETTALYKQIVGSGYYETETMIKIQDTSDVMVEFREDSILDVSISRGAFNGSNLAIGSAPIASCSITLVSDDFSAKEISRNIPKSARIEIYERVTDGYSVSEWLLQGVFFVDRRDSTSWTGRLRLDGLDAMVLADAGFPGSSQGWPTGGKLDTDVVDIIANQMGVDVSASTNLDKRYRIPFPGTFTMREVLSYIAVMYCGNWIINKAGELELLKIGDLPSESFDLITMSGDSITIQDEYIQKKIIIRGGIYIG